jgi:hypothetical protein
MVKEQRGRIVDIIDELLEGFLLLRSPLQLEHHVGKGQIIGDPPAIVQGLCFRARVAPEGNQVGINLILSEIILCGLYLLKKTKPYDGEK